MVVILLILFIFVTIFFIFYKNNNKKNEKYFISPNPNKLSNVVKEILDKRNLKYNENNWTYYFPNSYVKCDTEIKKFINLVDKKIFMIDSCNSFNSKINYGYHLYQCMVEIKHKNILQIHLF